MNKNTHSYRFNRKPGVLCVCNRKDEFISITPDLSFFFFFLMFQSLLDFYFVGTKNQITRIMKLQKGSQPEQQIYFQVKKYYKYILQRKIHCVITLVISYTYRNHFNQSNKRKISNLHSLYRPLRARADMSICPTMTKQSNCYMYWLFRGRCQLLCKASVDSKLSIGQLLSFVMVGQMDITVLALRGRYMSRKLISLPSNQRF